MNEEKRETPDQESLFGAGAWIRRVAMAGAPVTLILIIVAKLFGSGSGFAGTEGLRVRGIHPQDTSRISLQQVAEFVLPDSFELTGVAIGSADQIVAWSTTNHHVVLLRRGSWRLIGGGLLQRPVAAGFVEYSDEIEVFDAHHGSVFRFASDGSVMHRSVHPDLRNVRAAAVGANGWYFVPAATHTTHIIMALNSDGRREVVAPLPQSPLWKSDSAQAGLALSSAADGVLVSYRVPPYGTFRVTRSGVVKGFASPLFLSDPASGEAHRDQGIWAALPVLPAPDGYIQSYADLTSDRRVFVLYDSQGRIVREVPVDAPLGLQASVPERFRLAAITRLSGFEIRLYEWRDSKGGQR